MKRGFCLYLFLLKTTTLKKLIFTTALLLSIFSFAQSEKSLLWEISGNGLPKNSYLYGTMHVNDKISYHLSDAFYRHLLEADIVSNESNPETWGSAIDLFRNDDRNRYIEKNFYSNFYLTEIKKDNLYPLFKNSNMYYKMTFGDDTEQANFQENTVLDMFIHQTGRKYNKNVTGLEDAKKSMLSLMKMQQDYSEPSEENRTAIVKILKNRSYLQVLNDFYREKDVVMLDSIYRLLYPKKSHKILIVDRNEVMAHSIDSLARKGSLFAAIGAAHLSGKKGVIQLLKDKGYTVKPIFDEMTAAGEKQKKQIEEFFPSPDLSSFETADKMFKLPLYKNHRVSEEMITAVDLTNGGSININRVPLNVFLNKKEDTYNPKVLDSLFFENIPGNILDKKYVETESYKSYDIKNKTKSGNYQRYKFYITPLEIISFSMVGTGEYVKQYESQLFDKIEFKNFTSSWEKFSPIDGGFSVEMPSYNFVYGNEKDSNEDISIEAYDKSENAYYFLKEKTLDDTDFLEDTKFENKQIQSEFYMQNDMEMLTQDFDNVNATNESSSKLNNKNVRLKTIIKGAKYYLLGTVNANNENSNKFFKSFNFQSFNENKDAKLLNDTISKFNVEIPEKINEKLFLNLDDATFKSKNKFLSKNKKIIIKSNSNRKVSLHYNKFHKYEYIKNVDSLKNYFFKNYLNKDYLYENDDMTVDSVSVVAYEDRYSDDYNSISLQNNSFYNRKGFSKSLWNKLLENSDDKYEYLSKSYTFNKDKNTHIIEAIVSKPKATQAIKYKTFIKDDSYYELKTLVDKEYKNNDEFIEKTFQTFEPTCKDTISVFDDKLNLFMKDAYSKKDTIRFSAMESIGELTILEKDFDAITNFINTFKFKDSETDEISTLLLKIGKLNDSRVIPFLEEKYKAENTKTTVQISVLEALANQKSKAGYQKIMELLDYDLPISDEKYEITNLFNSFQRDLQNSKELFPKIFEYYSIKEYNEPIVNFCNMLLDKNLVSAKKISSFRKIILTNTKLEYKRIVSWKEKNIKPEEDEDKEDESIANDEVVETVEAAAAAVEAAATESIYDNGSVPVRDLINYINLLYNFKEDSETKAVLDKIEKLDIPELNIELLRLAIINDKADKTKIESALANSKTKFPAIRLLVYKDKFDVLPTIKDDEIAEAVLKNFKNIKPKDSIQFVEKRIEHKDGKEISFYFYKITSKKGKKDSAKKVLHSIAFVNENGKINPLAFNVFESKELNEEDDIKKKMNSIINQSLNSEHYRATFEKEEENRFFRYNDY